MATVLGVSKHHTRGLRSCSGRKDLLRKNNQNKAGSMEFDRTLARAEALLR